jgi:uncharacterized RDD family membrane protein YckC
VSWQGPAGPASSVAAGADPSDELVVATPERVAFRFETAGLGSRFVAQVIDGLILWAIVLALGLVSIGISTFLGASTAAALLFGLGGFALLWAWLILPEALWSGQTVGKYVMHLRVVDARGGPIRPGQAVVRNLFRIVDFLPFYYAVGTVAIFLSARNQRLGDLAAGTVVVRERLAVRLGDLASSDPAAPAVAGPGRAPARLDPALRRFVVAYAQRRPGLTVGRREQLALQVEPALRAALPDVVAAGGPLAALDRLADEVTAS